MMKENMSGLAATAERGYGVGRGMECSVAGERGKTDTDMGLGGFCDSMNRKRKKISAC